MYTTDLYEGMLAETVSISGANGDALNAYFARPLGAGPVPASCSSTTFRATAARPWPH